MVNRGGVVTLMIFVGLIGVCPMVVSALTEQRELSLLPPSVVSLKPLTVSDSITMTRLVDPTDNGIAEHPKVSPDERRFLLVTEKGDLTTNLREYSMFVYDLLEPLRKPVKIAVLRSSSNREAIKAAKWLDNDKIVFIGENPGETPQVYAAFWRSGKIEKITNDSQGVVDYAVTPDLQTVAYYATWHGDDKVNKYKEEHGFAVSDEGLAALMNGRWKTPSGIYQMYVVNRSTGRTQEIKATPFRSARHSVWLSPNGRYAVTEQPAFAIDPSWGMYDQPFIKAHAQDEISVPQKIRNANLTQPIFVDLESGEVKVILNAPIGLFGLTVAWSADGKSVFLGDVYLPLTAADTEELAKRKSSTFVAEVQIPSFSLQTVALLPRNEVWQLRDGTRSERFQAKIWTIGDGDIYGIPSTFSFTKIKNGWSRSRNGEDTEPGLNITISQSIDRRPRLVMVDSRSHSETLIFDPNPQFDHLQFGHAEVIRWKGKRGEDLIGGLLYPVGYTSGVRYPLVIQTHGFNPEMFLLDGPMTTAMAAQELANKGIAVLQLGESPLYDRAEGTPDFGPVNLSQYESAIDYLDGLGLIDRKKVGLVGFSITGFPVRYALIHSHYTFAAATSAEGNDWSYWTYVAFSNFPSWVTQAEMPYGGPPWSGNWKTWLEEAIGFNYDKINTPLRLESDNNPGEVIAEWENFFALRRLHKPVELIYVSNGWHPVQKPWDRMTSQGGNVDWMVFWLKGEEDPDPSKLEQYQRWNKLKALQAADKRSSVDSSVSMDLSGQ